MSRHQRHDANVVKWLSFVGPVKAWVKYAFLNDFFEPFEAAESELTIVHYFF